jgi:hypothetical protein
MAASSTARFQTSADGGGRLGRLLTRVPAWVPRVESHGWSYPLSDRRLTGVELVASAGLTALLASAVFGRYIAAGGFHSDDWAIAAHYAFAPEPRFWNTVADIGDVLGARPLLGLFLAVPHALFGLDASLHIALAVGLSALVAFLFYVFLRTLRFSPLHAAVPAVLALLFPWSDSTRFWATAGINNVAICFFLVGAVVALAGLDAGGRRAVALHTGAVTLFVASVLTYEIAAAAALLAGVLYLTRAPWRRVWPRWAADVVAVAGAMTYSAVASAGVRYVPPLPYKIKVVPGDTCEVLSIVASSFLPPGAAYPAAQLAVLLAVVGAVLVIRRSQPVDRAHLRAWIAVVVVAAVWTAAAYAITLGALSPLDFGTHNRGNAFAALPLALLVYAGAMTIASGLARGSRSQRLLPAVAVAVTVLVAVGYVERLDRDEQLWLDAHRRQQQILAEFARHPKPASESVVYMYGTPTHSAPAVPIFAHGWDLTGALKLLWNEPSLDSVPLARGSRLVCDRDRVYPTGNGLGRQDGSAYGSAVLADPAGGRWSQPQSQAECRQALIGFRPAPGPLVPVPQSCPLRRLAEARVVGA